jgi:hypothetical protein
MKSALEVAAKAAAMFVAVVYAFGFLIIAIHHSQFGIPQFDPFRPNILLVGIVFLVLLGLPAVALMRMMGLFNLEKQGLGFLTINFQPEEKTYIQGILLLQFYPMCGFTLGWLSGFLFGGFENVRPWGNTFVFLWIALDLATLLTVTKYFHRFPGRCLTLQAMVAGAYGTIVFRFEDPLLFIMTLWFFAAGFLSFAFHSTVTNPEERRKFEWELQLPVVAGGLLLYSTLIYARILPAFGGGMPTPAVLYFESKNPLSSSGSADVQLIEESDKGFYVLDPRVDTMAYFLRRDIVSMIHYRKIGK